MHRFSWLCLLAVAVVGCMKPLSEQVKKDPNSIIGKKTQDIKKFDPNAKQEVSDGKIRASDPILAPVQAYGPMLESISKSHIDHALQLFNATEGRYPKDYDEFMTRIIKENNIQLPVLPFKAQYQYDEKNHKLVVVNAPEAAPAGGAKPPETAPAAVKP